MKVFCLLLVAFFGLIVGERMRYDNFKLVQFKIENEEQLYKMQHLEENYSGVRF